MKKLDEGFYSMSKKEKKATRDFLNKAYPYKRSIKRRKDGTVKS